MIGLLKRLFGLEKSNGPLPETKKAEQRLSTELDAWNDTMKEVTRVQRLAAGKTQPVHVRRKHAPR